MPAHLAPAAHAAVRCTGLPGSGMASGTLSLRSVWWWWWPVVGAAQHNLRCCRDLTAPGVQTNQPVWVWTQGSRAWNRLCEYKSVSEHCFRPGHLCRAAPAGLYSWALSPAEELPCSGHRKTGWRRWQERSGQGTCRAVTDRDRKGVTHLAVQAQQ